ncbi:MAG: C1 family peptidase [Candidatus Thermoplasmatota archaeon]
MKRFKKIIAVFIISLLIGVGCLQNSQTLAFKYKKNTDLPNSFSWTNINGTDFTTPVKNQAPAPTCEAYALCASLETLMQYKKKELYNPDLSETHLYFYAGGTYKAGGVNVRDAAEYLVEQGVPDEGCYPDPHRGYDYPFRSLEGWENRTVKIKEWGWVEHEPESIKKALVEHGPLVVCIYVWKDFKFYSSGIYEHQWGLLEGGHLVTIMGYNDDLEYWLVKNSWGDQWGLDGWFKMSYDAEMFINNCYGGESGIMYIDGVYGNLKPDVPKIKLEKPENFKTYLFGMEFSTLFKTLPKLSSIQKAAARIIGPMTIDVETNNTDFVEFYLDGKLQETDEKPPFEFKLPRKPGNHTIKLLAYNSHSRSQEIVDVYIF